MAKRRTWLEELDYQLAQRNLPTTKQAGVRKVWQKSAAEAEQAPVEIFKDTPKKTLDELGPVGRAAMARRLANTEISRAVAEGWTVDDVQKAREWYRGTSVYSRYHDVPADETVTPSGTATGRPVVGSTKPTTSTTSTEGLAEAEAAKAGKALAVDFGLARGIRQMGDTKPGPTKAASRRQRTGKQQTPEPGSAAWAAERKRAAEEAEKAARKKAALEAQLNPKTPAVKGAGQLPSRTSNKTLKDVSDWLARTTDVPPGKMAQPTSNPADVGRRAARLAEEKRKSELGPFGYKPKPAPTYRRKKGSKGSQIGGGR